MSEKLNRLRVAKTLKSIGLSIFTPRDFIGVFQVIPKTASSFLRSNTKMGFFIKFRNGFYALADTPPHHFVIANKLYEPSYISLETALSRHGIIPEVVYATTSVTTKATREFETPLGVFSYQRVKRTAYRGYSPVKIDGNIVFLADPEKALADHLYFVDIRRSELNDRISLKKIDRKKLLEYAMLFERVSLLKRIDTLYVEQSQPRTIY